ncbi:hypothetical protein LTR94_035385, partial [Friedmanniomyces endolithicus]
DRRRGGGWLPAHRPDGDRGRRRAGALRDGALGSRRAVVDAGFRVLSRAAGVGLHRAQHRAATGRSGGGCGHDGRRDPPGGL